MLTKTRRLAIPRFVVVLITVDLALGALYLADFMLGQPFKPFAKLIDLDGETNLPTWYSSIQWFCVAFVLWLFAERHIDRGRVRSWFLLALPLVFLLFSLDEVAQIHERLGDLSDTVLPNGTREGTLVSSTGLFFLFVGVPFVLVFIGLIAAIRPFLVRYPGAFLKLAVGMIVFLVAAVGLDALSNFVVEGSLAGTIQVLTEEVSEMIGATIVLWGAYGLIADTRADDGLL